MTKEEKQEAIDVLTERLSSSKNIYLTDIAGLNADESSALRRLCFNKQVSLSVVKNTLLKKAMEKSEKEFDDLYDLLKGNTSIMISETGNAPAKVIKEFRKKKEKPILKGAYVEESIYVGDTELESLVNLKSKEELIGDVILLLQSPLKNVVSGLQSGGHTISGILQTLSEKAE